MEAAVAGRPLPWPHRVRPAASHESGNGVTAPKGSIPSGASSGQRRSDRLRS